MTSKALNVVVAGGTGFIGRHLCAALSESGHKVTSVTRGSATKPRTPENVEIKTWEQLQKDVSHQNTDTFDACVNLCGLPVLGGSRWNHTYKQQLVASRTLTTNRLSEIMAMQLQHRDGQKKIPFVVASAVGYYPSNDNADEGRIFDESYVPTEKEIQSQFAVKLCHEVETNAVEQTEGKFGSDRMQCVRVRTAVVLGDDGALPQLKLPFLFGAGAYMGTGQQAFPWIHIDDIVGIYQHAIESICLNENSDENKRFPSVLNAVSAPPFTTNRQFSDVLLQVIRSSPDNILLKLVPPKVLFRIPEFVLKPLLGEGAVLLTEGQKVLPKNTVESGYKFKHDDLRKTLQSLLHD